jgi:hypothetical protein
MLIVSLLLIVAWVSTALDLKNQTETDGYLRKIPEWEVLLAVPLFWLMGIIEYIHNKNEARRSQKL